MPPLPFREDLTGRRRSTLLFFFVASLLSAGAISLNGKIPSFRIVLFSLAVASACVAIFTLAPFPAR